MSKSIIKVNNLSKKYKNFTAVNKLDLDVKENSIYAFLGPNGAGKTTTIRMLLGLIKKSEGEIEIFGKSLDTNKEEILSNIGSLVEGPSFYPNLTAKENLKIFSLLKNADESEIERVLQQVNLYNVKDKAVKHYSLGMKQRLGIGIALLGNPKILILDEPTNGLDPAGMHEVRDLIIKLAKDEGKTIFISSHILREIELIATHCGIIKNGNLKFQGTIDELKALSKPNLKVKSFNSDKAVNILKENNIKFELKNNTVIINNNRYKPSEINKALVDGGAEVYYLCEKKLDLEDIFLDITEGA